MDPSAPDYRRPESDSSFQYHGQEGGSSGRPREERKFYQRASEGYKWIARVAALVVLSILVQFLMGEINAVRGIDANPDNTYTKKIRVKVKDNPEGVIHAVEALDRDDVRIDAKTIHISLGRVRTLAMVSLFLVFALLPAVFIVLYLIILSLMLRFSTGGRESPQAGMHCEPVEGMRIRETGAGVEFSIRGRMGNIQVAAEGKRAGSKFFASFWLLFWTFGGIAAIGTLLVTVKDLIIGKDTDNPVWFLLIWLCGWAFGEFMVARMLFEKEKVVVSRGRLCLVKSILGIPFQRKEYDSAGISDFKVVLRGLVFCLGFLHNEKQVDFFIDLPETTGHDVLARMTALLSR
ncbi:MAG: hypothetical protein GY765_35070 [bacterium]|nr:hypothetical protein [bacterium]